MKRAAGAAVGVLMLGVVACGGGEAEPSALTATAPPETSPSGTADDDGRPVFYDIEVVNRYDHDRTAYTQGLEFVDGRLLESTGRRGRSVIRLVDPETGDVEDNVELPPSLYGEGATVVGDEVWQLTYTSETVLVRDLDGLAERRRFDYDGEGWGLCHDGQRLIMSNGSAELTFRDRDRFEITGRVTVTIDDEPLDKLNELECVGGTVWANVYQTNRIVEIDPDRGEVIGIADLTSLVPDGYTDERDLVLNGIAHNPDTGHLWVTGKEWPVMYELKLEPGS